MSSTAIAQINAAIQAGRGAAAGVLGQQYDVYRLGLTTNNAIIGGAPVITGFPARIARAKKINIENQVFDIQVFEATCDNRLLQLQDVLYENPAYAGNGGAAYVYAQSRPTRQTMFVRTEFNISITRPVPSAGQASQVPATGGVYLSGDPYSAYERDTEQVLTLNGGLFSFSTSSGVTQASIPAGLQPLNRVRDGNQIDLSTDLPRVHSLVYLPMLPGVILNENDILSFPQSAGTPDRYDVKMLYTSEYTGLSGWITVVEKRAN